METKFEKHILTTAVPFSKLEELVKRATAERHYTIQTYLEWCDAKNNPNLDKASLQKYADNVNSGKTNLTETLLLLHTSAAAIARELFEMDNISIKE